MNDQRRFWGGAGTVREAARVAFSARSFQLSAGEPAGLGQGRRSAASLPQAGFTLVELLVVIAIIAILAGLLIPLSGVASTKMRIARTKAELNNLVAAIEGYKAELGEYPPDNGLIRNLSASDSRYKTNAGMSPLYYELAGCVFTNRQFQVVASSEVITTNLLGKYFYRDGIRNSARARFNVEFKGFTPKASQYAELTLPGNERVMIMTVPVPGPIRLQSRKGMVNPWFYDASSTNRNNRASFDLWAEIVVGGRTNIIGNWKN